MAAKLPFLLQKTEIKKKKTQTKLLQSYIHVYVLYILHSHYPKHVPYPYGLNSQWKAAMN